MLNSATSLCVWGDGGGGWGAVAGLDIIGLCFNLLALGEELVELV